MKLVKNETKREVITGTVTLELTPQELATITAAMGKTSYEDVERSAFVSRNHLVSPDGKHTLWHELREQYEAVYGGAR